MANKSTSIFAMAGVAEGDFAALRAKSSHKALHPAAARNTSPGSAELSAAAADKLLGGGLWFRGHAERVMRRVRPRVAGDLTFPRKTGPFVVCEGGLRVEGKLTVGHARTILAVCGELEVDALEVGDGVLVVTGQVLARSAVFMARGEGILQVAGAQSPPKLLRHIRTPWLVLYDRRAGELRVFRALSGALVPVASDALLPALLEDGRPHEGRIRSRLARGLALTRR